MKQVTLKFDAASHSYTDEQGMPYTPVTSFIGEFDKPFNSRYWGMYTALKNNGYRLRYEPNTEEYITVNNRRTHIDKLYADPLKAILVKGTKKEWKNVTDKSLVRGNTIHDHLEDSINLSKGDVKGKTNEMIKPLSGFVRLDTKHDLDKTNLQETFPAIYNRLLGYINMGCILFAEKRIYNPYFYLAGTIDVLIVKGKYFAILDWKTNKDFMHFTSGYYKKVKMPNGKWEKSDQYIETDDRLLEPINHLQKCKGIIYSLQLSAYAWMMIQWGYKLIPDGLEIFHIRPDMQPKLIKIKYLGKEIKDMLEYRQQKKTRQPKKENKLKLGIYE